MPSIELLNAKTVWVGEPYQVPGTDIRIWKIKLEINGQRDTYSTMSQAVATDGFAGDLELYTNDKGKEYVRQLKKPDSPGVAQGHGDQFTMYLSYAKDLVVALQESSGFDKELFKTLLSATIKGGKALYNARPGATEAPDIKPSGSSVSAENSQDPFAGVNLEE